MKGKFFSAVLAALVLCLSGCAGQPSEPQLPPAQTTCGSPEQTREPEAVQNLPPETVPPQTSAATMPTEPEPPQPTEALIQDSLALRDYLREQEEAGIRSFSFRYSESLVDVSAQNLARTGGYFYVEARTEGDLCYVQVTPYPGDRIVEAWYSGNPDALSEPERQALETALSMVELARQTASDSLELERLLFDMFRSHVSYNDGSTEISDPRNPPRHLTAVGALVDGSANCQGYADGFYVLASLAGFRVSRMHVDIPEGGHTVNVIYLDGAWYVVDSTYNDLNDPSGVQISYGLLNVGRDKCMRYSWDAEMERYPIVDGTDHHFYYYREEAVSSRVFGDVNAMAQRIVDDWRAWGSTEFYLLLEGTTADWSELGTALEQTAEAAGFHLSYSIWHEHNVRDTYFYVKLG